MVTFEYANAYLSARNHAAWLDLTLQEQQATLLRARDFLNSLPWQGTALEPERVQCWPRKAMFYIDNSPVPQDIIPEAVLHAQCEIAAAMANGYAPLLPQNPAQGPILSEKLDSIAITYAAPKETNCPSITGMPAVDALLKPFLKPAGLRFAQQQLQRA